MHQYIKVLKNYTTFTGRASRSEYWWFVLVNLIITVILELILTGIGRAIGSPHFNNLTWIYSIAILIPSIAVVIRRLHDTNRSGWWIWLKWGPGIAFIILMFLFGALAIAVHGSVGLMAASTVGLVVLILTGLSVLASIGCGIALLVFLIFDSTPGDNRFGPNPKGVTSAPKPAPTKPQEEKKDSE